MSRKKKAHQHAIFFADLVAIIHFVSLNLLLVVGKFTEVFNWVGGYYPEIDFILKYVDLPVYSVAKRLVDMPLEYGLALGYVEVVMITSSLLYGFLGYIFVRLVLIPMKSS